MTQADVATTIDNSRLKTRFLEASTLNAHAYYAVAPGTYIALMKLHNVEHYKSGKKDAGNISVTSNAAMFARKFLSDLDGDNLPVPSVCPVEGGNVALIWTLGVRQLEAIFCSDSLGSFVLSDGDKIIDDGDIATDDSSSLERALEDLMA